MLTVSATLISGNQSELTFAVRDTGIGLTTEGQVELKGKAAAVDIFAIAAEALA